MSEELLAGLRGQYQDIESRIAGMGDPDSRDGVKRDIIALFKRVDGALSDLGQLKEDIRGLVERYKQAGATTETTSAAPAQAPEFTGARPVVHADHLGASTFIEKGWSLISLGDYAGAIQALEKALTLSPGAVQAQSLLGWAQMLQEEYDEALATFSKVLMKEPTNTLARVNVGLHLPQEADLRRGDRAPLQGDPAGQRSQGDALRPLLSRPGVPGAGDVRGRRRLSSGRP